MIRKMKRILKVALTIIITYLVIALLFSLIPYIHQKEVSTEAQTELLTYEDMIENKGTDDRVLLIEDPYNTFNVRHELIRNAQKSIHLSYYIFHNGNSTNAFMGDLLQAADRGVDVKISIDGKIKYMDPKVYRNLKTLNEHENINVKLYNPVNFVNSRHWQSMLHDKYLLVDDEYALVGGNNIGDKYFAPSDYNGSITEDRDVLVRNVNHSEESVVNDLKNYANEFWNLDILKAVISKHDDGNKQSDLIKISRDYRNQQPQLYQQTLSDYTSQMVKTNKVSLVYNPTHNGPKEPWVGYQLKALSKHAKSEVIIQSPYSTSNKEIITFMEDLTGRDIKVSLITNSMASTPNILAFSNYKYARKKYLDVGVQVYEYQSLKDSLHAKTMLVDDRFSVLGTFNMDDRSIYVSTEMMLIIDSPEFNDIVKQEVLRIKGQSLELDSNLSYKNDVDNIEKPVSMVKRILIAITSFFTRIFEFVI